MQNQLEDIDPASNVKNFNEGGFLSKLQEKVYDATKGFMPDPGEFVGEQMEAVAEDPLNAAANATLALYGGPALIRGGTTLLGPIIKKFGAKYGPAVLQRAKDLALRATTKPNPAATPRVGNAPGQIKKGVVQPTQGTQIPKGQPGAGRMQAGPPGRVVDPLRIGVGTALGVKAADAIMGGEETEEAAALTEADIFRRDAPAGLVSAIDAAEGEQAALRSMFPNAPEMTAQQRTDKRARVARGGGDRPARRGAGLSGLLEQAKPYASTAASIAQILGRGAGASKGFEGAKIVEESAKLRAAEQARQDRKEALDAELGVRREQISATKAAAEAAAGARLSQAQADIVAEFINNNNTYLMAAKAEAKKRGTTVGDPAVAAALRPLVQEHLRTVFSSVGGMGGLGTQQGLSAEQRAKLEAFVAS